MSRVLPDRYPLEGKLDDYVAAEHLVGRLLDLGVVTPRLTELYGWAADELRVPELADLVSGSTPTYAWDPADRAPGRPHRRVSCGRAAVVTAPRPPAANA